MQQRIPHLLQGRSVDIEGLDGLEGAHQAEWKREEGIQPYPYHTLESNEAKGGEELGQIDEKWDHPDVIIWVSLLCLCLLFDLHGTPVFEWEEPQ